MEIGCGWYWNDCGRLGLERQRDEDEVVDTSEPAGLEVWRGVAGDPGTFLCRTCFGSAVTREAFSGVTQDCRGFSGTGGEEEKLSWLSGVPW